MDDFEDDDLYDDDDQYDYGDDESIKDKYDRYKDYKDRYEKFKNRNSNKAASDPIEKKAGQELENNLAQEGGKQAGKEAGKEAGKQAGKEAGKQAAKEGTKQVGKEAGKQAAKEGTKQAGKEVGKQAAKEGGKLAAKEGAKVAAEGAASSTGYGVIIAAAIEVLDRLKKVQDKLDAKIKEETGVDAKKVRRWSPLAIMFAIIVLICLIFFLLPALLMMALSDTATSELSTLVRTREFSNDKELILFTKSEMSDLLSKDIEVDENIATKLAEEGFTLVQKRFGNNIHYYSLSYMNILNSYKDIRNTFSPKDLTGISDGMEDILGAGQSYDDLNEEQKRNAASIKNVHKYLLAEVENFNKVDWQKASLSANYDITGARKSKKYTGDSAYNSYLNDPNKVTGISGTIASESVEANYTVKDKKKKDTMLKTPDFNALGVEGDKNERALSYVSILSPYMQKWIIPYTIYIDTQDDEFVDGLMKNVYHPVDVKFFQLKKLVKTATFDYYMECYTYTATRYVYKTGITNSIVSSLTTDFEIQGTIQFGKNTKTDPLGEHLQKEEFIEEIESNGKKYKKYKQTYKISKLNATHDIAKDSSGNPMVKSVKIERRLENAETIPEITYIGGFYEIIEKEFEITPIDETSSPNESNTGNMSVDESSGIGTQVLTESWKETIKQTSYKMTDYEVSYLTDEDLEKLGRKVSIIEWYQDTRGGATAAAGDISGGSGSESQRQFIERVKDFAIADMNESGVLASITIAQAVLEGGSGGSTLASQYHNHFGINAGSTWKGATITMRTRMYSPSQGYYMGTQTFRAYANDADGFADHSQFLWNTRGHSTKPGGYRYRDCTEYAKPGKMTYTAEDGQPTYDFVSAMQTILDGGYTNDPTYLTAICKIINTYKLYEYDRQSTWDGTPPSYALGADGTPGGGGGASGASKGTGKTAYSYEDMEFAFYQIEQWYKLHAINYSALNLGDRVILPEGGFAWPVQYYADEKAKSIYRFFGAKFDNGSEHKGLDIFTGNTFYWDSDNKLNKGAIVVATHPGVVTKVKKVEDESKNAYIEIKTEDGFFKTRYCHLSEINVKEGDTVEKEQVIGRIGRTGAHSDDLSGTDLYLHYEVYYKGENMDPLTYYNITGPDGKVVKNYDELDLESITNPKQYKFESSKTYIGGGSEVVDFAMQYLGNDLAAMNRVRGTNFQDHWCAWFACWCYEQCGLGDIVAVSNKNYCPTIWNEVKGVKHPHGDGYVPQPGDLIMFQNSSGVFSHIAIVSKVENGVVHWVGGNQGGNCPHGSHVTENSQDSRTKSYISPN